MSKISLLQVLQLQNKKKWKYLPLQENLTRSYEKSLYVDAVLKVEDKLFRAHRCILCFHSPVLKNAFYSTKIPATGCTIKEIKAEGFEILLRYLYTSGISNEVKSDDLVEACYAAQILQMVEIEEKLIHYILYRSKQFKKFFGKTIADVQFWSLLEKCRTINFEVFQEKLLKFAESNFRSVFECEGFVAADIKTVKVVLNRKYPLVPQSYILESIARWTEANGHLVLLDQYIKELLNCVDFKKLSPKEFYAFASKHDRLLSKKDSLDILMHLNDSTVCPLPTWYQLNDKEWNFPANLETEWKFKSTDDIWNNLNSTESDWRKKESQSQEDLRKTAKIKNCEKSKRKIRGYFFPLPSAVVARQDVGRSRKTLQENFYQMLEEGLFTDVTLIAKDNIKIPAHSLVLALGSEFFADVFYMATPTSKTLRIDETAKDVKDMLRYFYGCGTGIESGLSLECILKKNEMALKYLCYPMMKVYNEALFQMTLNPVYFWTLTGWVDQQSQFNVDSEILMRYAATSTKQIFEHDSFLSASKHSLVMVLKSDYLNIAEYDLLEHVARWIKKNSKQLPSDSSKKKLLESIRFESLVAEQFFTFLQKHEGILPIQDAFEVLEFLFHRREENCLPAWCYRGPLRSVFYDPLTKIGTNVPVPWSGIVEKGKNWFCSSYTVSIRDKRSKSEIQFLEVSLHFKAPPNGQCTPDCSCSVTISTDGYGFLKTFQDLKMSQQQRYLLPVCFSLDASCNRSIKLIMRVDAKHSHKFYSVSKQALEFDNTAFLMTSGNINCLCDAIVDGFTSENIPIPPHLLANRNEVVKTETFFKVTPDPKT